MLQVGTICKIHSLQLAPQLNGQYCEILKPLANVKVPEPDGVVRDAPRYGCEVITAPCDEEKLGPVSGFSNPRISSQSPGATRRAIDLHLFGWTNDN